MNGVFLVLGEQLSKERLVVGTQVRMACVAIAAQAELKPTNVFLAIGKAFVRKFDSKSSITAFFKRLIHEIAFVVGVIQDIAVIYDVCNRHRLCKSAGA